jgi:hypothetical protein
VQDITVTGAPEERDRRAWQALAVWVVFIVLLVLVNGTVPFMLGVDVRAWTSSLAKAIAFDLIFYAGFFLIVPLILTKGWKTVRQPAFLLPLLVAVIGIGLHPLVHPAPVLAYLHWRFELSDLGIRSRGWKGDLLAILLMGVVSLAPVLLPGSHPFSPGNAASAALDRLVANPASTVENLFYFGFLTERLLYKTKWVMSLVIASMYTLHEMSNPEYWYGHLSFVFVFVAIAVAAAIYLWRRSLVVTWLGDILSRFVTQLF